MPRFRELDGGHQPREAATHHGEARFGCHSLTESTVFFTEANDFWARLLFRVEPQPR